MPPNPTGFDPYVLREPWVKTIQEEKKQQKHQILKKQMSQEKRWREKGPQDILFLAFKSRKKEKKKKRLKIAAELPENPNVNGKLDLLWLRSAQTDARLRSRRDGFRECSGTALQSSICYCSPLLCPKIPARKPGKSGLFLWKSQDRTESSELVGAAPGMSPPGCWKDANPLQDARAHSMHF